ncbi:MAG: hypothetical protein O7E52_27925 [Candidatus Poribacteria bacterium]|nr:hypothetical protein [Candidatus Poribacteria bacterium]
MLSYEQYLRNSVVPKEVLDVFLDSAQPSWAQFHPELGYTLGNSLPRDGLDGCSTISTAQNNGARTAHMYINQPCRINTYGNSFTQCHQVSDGETWQEYLAAHLGEPIRNFGMGGYGVYQAYRRMVATERTDESADYVMLYIWGDDHLRSIMRCRYAVIYPWWNHREGLAFHNNFWANLEMDIELGQFVEKANLLPTPESLYRMIDADFMVEALKDDLMVQLSVVGRVAPSSLDVARLKALAEILDVPSIDATDPDGLTASAERLKYAYGFAATKYIIEKSVDFCQENDKALLIVLLCPTATRQLLHNQGRYDQEVVDYLDGKGLRYFDMNRVHLEDHKAFNLSVEDYMKRYYIGHYSPAGNHFFAYSIKATIVDWLSPKPITYRTDEGQWVDFRGYLPD